MEKNKNTDFKLIKNSKGEIIGHVKKLWFREFLRIVYDIYGLYLDSTYGFISINKLIVKSQKEIVKHSKIDISNLNKQNFYYGKGPPDNEDSHIMYISKIGEIRERNKKNGRNFKNIANFCLVLIYQYWEDYYREKIANDIGIEKKSLKLDIFGDIRILRKSIIHHRAKALEEVEKCNLLKWFKKGDEININNEKFVIIINYIFNSIYNDISEEYKKYGYANIKQEEYVSKKYLNLE
jgi:hypothetical protein